MIDAPRKPRVSYWELVRLFVRLSLTAFGGPVAHVAIAEDEIVHRRKWLSREHFLDLIAATNLIPGPNSTEVMIHVGYVMRGIPGAVVTGACFIIPAFVLTLILAVLYVQTGDLPQANALFWGIKPVIVAIIANAGYRLMRAALKGRDLWLLFAACVVLIGPLDGPEVLVMLGAGVVYALYRTRRVQSSAAWLTIGVQPLLQAAATLAAQPSLVDIFVYFLRIGAVLFGSGYVLIAYIQQDVVNRFGWLTGQQLLDAIAIGQTTPGPVSTTSAVVGYIIAGVPGALAATLGIFLPSFVFVILSAPLIPRMRRSPFMSAFLAGVNAGVIAAIGITLLDLTRVALLNPDGTQFSLLAVALAAGSLFVLIRFRINATWLIAIGGAVGLIALAVGVT
ncbi:MAG: chromate efflux transporter [Anaerolineae bacterium]|nr:chromate efflux transporter [Anaerolineae bacterium]